MKLSEFARYDPTDNVTQIVLEAFEHFARPYAKSRTLTLDDGMLLIDAGIDGSLRFGADGIRIKGTGPTSGFTINPASYVGGTNFGLLNTWGRSKITLEDFAIDGSRAAVALSSEVKIGNSFLYVADGSSQVKVRGVTMDNLATTPVSEGFAIMVSGKASDFAAEDCDISNVAGSAFNLCGDQMKVSRCTIAGCDWNSISVYGGRRTILDTNILLSAKRRNLNFENGASAIVATGNYCEAAGWANIGNYDNGATPVDDVLISGNMLVNAGAGVTWPVGELDFVGAGRIKVGHNFYAPKPGGYILRTTGAVPNLVLEDSEITPARIIKV